MPSLTTASWRELSRTTRSECPKLFYLFSTKEDSLTIKVTDLVVVWECSLDRAGLIKAAKEQKSSIDPSESSSQLRVLLEKLQQSLDSGSNGLSRSTDLNVRTIYLKTELDLPRPLKPLSWTFELNPEDATELAEQLLRPCLHEASIAKQKVESLIRVIKDKDHVLSRLLEKVDSSAIDLSLIFPGITGLRSRKGHIATREAQKHVPGMSKFDQEKWNNDFEADTPYSGFHQMGMDNLVAGCEKCPKHTAKQHADWLKQLPTRGSDNDIVSANTKRPAKRKTLELRQSDVSTDTESGFERQPTPPHIRSKRPQDKQSSDNSLSSDEYESRPTKKAKLGRVGGLSNRNKSKEIPRKASNSPELKSSSIDRSSPIEPAPENSRTYKKKSDSETETASEAEVDPEQPSSDPKASTYIPPEQSQTRARLGKLGRLTSHSSRAGSEVSHSSTAPQPDHKRSSSPTARSPSARLGSSSPPTRNAKVNVLRDPKSSQQQPSKTKSQIASNSDDDKDKSTVSRASQIPLKREQSNRHTTDTDNDTKQPMTPTRRLGRLKNPRSGSTASTETTTNTPTKPRQDQDKSPTKPTKLNTNTTSDQDSDTDTETASEDEKPTNPLTAHPRTLSKLKPHPSSSTSTSTSTPDPETKPSAAAAVVEPETAQEKADRRREELKKRLNTAGGARKVRKF